MRLYFTSSVVHVDLRLMERSALGRSLVYGCVDAVVRGAPYTAAKVDVERVDRSYRARTLEYVLQLGPLKRENRTYYVCGP